MNEAAKVRSRALPACDEAPEVEEPGEKTLDFPATLVASKSAPVLPLMLAIGKVRRDQPHEVRLERRRELFRVVGFVADEPFWTEPTRDLAEGLLGESALGGRSAVDGSGQRNAVSVDNCHDLGAFSTLRRTDSIAPFFAGTKVPSMKPSSSWSLPRRFKSVSSARLTFSRVPSLVHCWKRRWQVAEDGYRAGKSCHGAPVRITHRIPFSTSRGSRHGLPRPSSRTTGLPSSGSNTFHCASLRSAIATFTNTPDPRWKASPIHGAISIGYAINHL